MDLTADERGALAQALLERSAAFLRLYENGGQRAGSGPIRLRVGDHSTLGDDDLILVQILESLVLSGRVVASWPRDEGGPEAELELRVTVDRTDFKDGRVMNSNHTAVLTFIDPASGSVAFAASCELPKQSMKGWFAN